MSKYKIEYSGSMMTGAGNSELLFSDEGLPKYIKAESRTEMLGILAEAVTPKNGVYALPSEIFITIVDEENNGVIERY